MSSSPLEDPPAEGGEDIPALTPEQEAALEQARRIRRAARRAKQTDRKERKRKKRRRRRRRARRALKNPLSVRVTDLHVEYEILSQRRSALRDRFVTRTGTSSTVVRAVRGVSFELHEGESVGIIGSNGSGKSTLLSAMAGLLPASQGTIEVSEDPKLLGVGAALLPKASGLRNVRLGLLALGMTSEEVDKHIDEVIEFAELGDAISRPLKTYSSGMRARLLFSIATATKPKVLLVDEALAVGDRKFRRKSSKRMRRLLKEAGTLVLVSHNLKEIRKLCNRVIWVEKGKIVADGPIRKVYRQYLEAEQAEVQGKGRKGRGRRNAKNRSAQAGPSTRDADGAGPTASPPSAE